MIVNLTVTAPDGAARAFEFRRARIQVGAGSKNDLIIQSRREAVRILALHASGSGCRVTPLSEDEPIDVFLPGESTAREPDESLILPVGSRIRGGSDLTTEIRIDSLRRSSAVRVETLGDLSMTAPSDFVPELPSGVATECLLLAYEIADEDDPSRFAAQVKSYLEGRVPHGTLVSCQVVLPSRESQRWESFRVFGSAAGALPVESIGIERSDIHASLCQSRIVVCSQQKDDVVLVPICVGSRLQALLALRVDTEAGPAVDTLLPGLLSLRPLVAAYADRYDRIAEFAAMEEENRYFRDRQRRHYLFKDLVTQSASMRRLHRELGGLVSLDAPALLTGEAGTGKELLARALHHLGGRAGAIMISQHCGALDEDALDFELFGYARRGEGASVASRRGIFELADGGTVFLDEIHALSPRLQLKLHRMLLEGEVFRIGESLARSVDVRVVASTHLDLMQLADEGRFRRDLAILLSKHVLNVPPLRDRREDLAPLVTTFVRQFARRYRKQVESVDPTTLAWMQKLRWPGNVRELLTVIERAVLRAEPDQIVLGRADFELK